GRRGGWECGVGIGGIAFPEVKRPEAGQGSDESEGAVSIAGEINRRSPEALALRESSLVGENQREESSHYDRAVFSKASGRESMRASGEGGIDLIHTDP